jgi:hypothetical protein
MCVSRVLSRIWSIGGFGGVNPGFRRFEDMWVVLEGGFV